MTADDATGGSTASGGGDSSGGSGAEEGDGGSVSSGGGAASGGDASSGGSNASGGTTQYTEEPSTPEQEAIAFTRTDTCGYTNIFGTCRVLSTDGELSGNTDCDAPVMVTAEMVFNNPNVDLYWPGFSSDLAFSVAPDVTWAGASLEAGTEIPCVLNELIPGTGTCTPSQVEYYLADLGLEGCR